ncbi:hypothetical protein HGP28_18770 [Vibrio sp. SM6]|uniref:Uncharacterized protein n=1 Tax=Vibrio agarilyticus TaxID=2726741 RepID=A0A7X8YIN2_9VIBR|nr:hypothetical protein [Vibrio agarilyticus]NLS14904.1 hypothetical protein [Vibrio agarilyticus]
MKWGALNERSVTSNKTRIERELKMPEKEIKPLKEHPVDFAQMLREELKRDNMSQPNFADAYYREVVGVNAEEYDLEKHRERFKKLLNSTDSRSPERIASYYRYFFQQYRTDGKYTYADKQAAWDMFVELDTSIATRSLKGGDIESALSRLAHLFNFHRQTAHKHGFGCRHYYETVNDIFEGSLRPFTTKWHGQFESGIKSDDQEKLCRKELRNLQKKLSELKEKLNGMCC